MASSLYLWILISNRVTHIVVHMIFKPFLESIYIYIFILLLIIIFFCKQLLFLIYFLSNLIKSSIQRWFPINLGTLNKMKSVVVLLFCILYCEVSGCTIVVYFISLWLIIKSNTFGCFCW